MQSPIRLLFAIIMTAGCGSAFESPESEPPEASDGGADSGSAAARVSLGGSDHSPGHELANGSRTSALGGDSGATEDAVAVFPAIGDDPVADASGQEGGDVGAMGASDACVPTGPELCDGRDNDCNGIIDDGPLCACEVHSLGASTYLFCARVQSWPSAATFCSARGAGLVSVDDKEEDGWLVTTAAGIADIAWWMGFNDRTTEKTWVWSDGTPTVYLHWASGQPNNHDGNEDCAALNAIPQAEGWNDLPCEDLRPFICESPVGRLSWP